METNPTDGETNSKNVVFTKEMKKAIENGSKVILGVNKYPNKSEKISQEKSTLSRLVADFESKIGEGAK